ncbi:ABC transporter G family member 21 [Aplysia californica]|uniref:ABC transporter G family member 21 n=1 Tax=Aplysia californica TaxID=6500 RepID=A0ABM1A0J6_APLCA|nr:ABC transporter G family member 21 [Aplysia californica]
MYLFVDERNNTFSLLQAASGRKTSTKTKKSFPFFLLPGGGKTTLLNTLAGRQMTDDGRITLNGATLSKDLKRQISYVLQEDIFFPNLTLRETLVFTAMIRLPDKMPRQDKMDRLEEVIDALDLRKCLDTIMGDAWARGLSGGEKKRASIACELITDPNLLYMDEPTSGLDYSTSWSLVSTLKHVATQFNKTVVLTIHQPSSKIFFLFDQLLLMCDGQVAYYGRCREVIDFFSELGFQIDSFTNPADFIVDKLKESEENKQKIIDAAKLCSSKARNGQMDDGNGTVRDNTKGQDSNLKSQTSNNETDGQLSGKDCVRVSLLQLDAEVQHPHDPRWPSGYWTQFSQLMLRTFRQSKTRILDKLKIIESVVLCILVSLIWFQLPRTEETLYDRMGVLFFISIHWGFTPLFDAVSSFPMERMVIHKERASGWYRLSAYYLAKMTSELPLTLLQPSLFLAVAYWCVGLHGVGPFFMSLLVIMVNALAGQSIGLLLGIICMDFRRAMAMATIFIMAIMLLGGFYSRSLPVWLDWIKYFSFINYTFHSLLYLEFSGADPFECSDTANASHFTSCKGANHSQIETSEILDYYDVKWSFASYFLPLFVFIFVMRTVGYIILRFVHRPTSV